MQKSLAVLAAVSVIIIAPTLRAQTAANATKAYSCLVTAQYDIISGGTKVHAVQECFERNGTELPVVDTKTQCTTTVGNPVGAFVYAGTDPSQFTVGCAPLPKNYNLILNSSISASLVTPSSESTSYFAYNQAIPNHAPAELVGSDVCPPGLIAVIGVALTDHAGYTACAASSALPSLTVSPAND